MTMVMDRMLCHSADMTRSRGLLTVLVAALLGFAHLSISGPAQARAVDGPTSYAEAVTRISEHTERVVSRRRFQSPSGNIYCSMKQIRACEISEGGVTKRNCAGPSKVVGRIEIFRGRPIAVCNTDTIRMPRPRTLPYGTLSVVGQMRCLSEEIGMTCVWDRTERGFFLRRGEYILF